MMMFTVTAALAQLNRRPQAQMHLVLVIMIGLAQVSLLMYCIETAQRCLGPCSDVA
jgi:hypothetical protein